jgi:hypothetical protein
VSETSREVRIRVDGMEESPGKAVLSRLAWPGYKADGASVSAPLRGYLLAVDIPAGSVGKTLTISFEPPGWPVVVVSIILSIGVAAAWTVAELTLSRRRRRPTEPVSPGGTAGPTAVGQDVGLSVKQ